jgi:hypothetical protein
MEMFYLTLGCLMGLVLGIGLSGCLFINMASGMRNLIEGFQKMDPALRERFFKLGEEKEAKDGDVKRTI